MYDSLLLINIVEGQKGEFDCFGDCSKSWLL
jgi:hypothetical protein